MNEKELIDKVLKGDTSAFSYFVDTYQDMAVTIAYRICGNRQDAEDIVQNAFVKAFHNLQTFRSTSKFSTWFYRIVYNTTLTSINERYKNIEFADYHTIENSSFSDWDIISQMEERERNNLLDEAMKKLPPDESLLLTLYYLEENSSKEIMAITNLTESNLKVKLHRARKRIGTILDPMLKR